MKTSILITSIASLCLLLTFAEAPRRHGEHNRTLTSADNISIITTTRAAMLPVVVITADRKKESGIAVPVLAEADFSSLKFDVAVYMKADAGSLNDAVILPEATEVDFSYLKFNISDYCNEYESPISEITELPVNENLVPVVTVAGPAVYGFEYLRFDVNDYINNSGTEAAGIGELPLGKTKNANPAKLSLPVETQDKFGYLKFDVTKYYPATLSFNEDFELPEK